MRPPTDEYWIEVERRLASGPGPRTSDLPASDVEQWLCLLPPTVSGDLAVVSLQRPAMRREACLCREKRISTDDNVCASQ
jgi:hypothetical protein